MTAKDGLLVVIWLVLSGAACAGSSTSTQQDASTLLEEVNSKGATAVVRSLWGKPAWQSVTEKIASGDAAWIDVALALRKGSDAGATSELHSAMFLALGRNPAYVLRTAEPQYSLSEICAGRVDPPPTFQEALAELTRTRAAVEQVQARELQSQKDLCLAKLREGEGHLKRFFGVQEK
jgi:hypothetical protein